MRHEADRQTDLVLYVCVCVYISLHTSDLHLLVPGQARSGVNSVITGQTVVYQTHHASLPVSITVTGQGQCLYSILCVFYDVGHVQSYTCAFSTV